MHTATEAGARSWRPTMDELYMWAVVLVVAARALLTNVEPHDFWFHLATGRSIVQYGEIPAVDMYSFTRGGTPYINGAWLSDVVLYLAYRLGGLPAVIILRAAALVGAHWLLMVVCRRSGCSRRAAAVLVGLVALPLSITNWAMRPQALVYPIFVAFLLVLWTHRDVSQRSSTSKSLWALPPLMVLWTNLHGSFPLGLALIAVFLVSGVAESSGVKGALGDRPLRRLSLVGLLCSLAVLVNPFGWRVVTYVASLMAHPGVQDAITEWTPPVVTTLAGAIFHASLLLLIALAWTSRHRPAWIDFLLASGFAVLALLAVRNIVWYGFAATSVMARMMRDRLPDRSHDPGNRNLNAAIVVSLCVLLLSTTPVVRTSLFDGTWGTLVTEPLPDATLNALTPRGTRPRRLFNELNQGSYLIWAAPEQRVFIDPRIELYTAEMVLDYQIMSAGLDVDRLFTKYRFDGALVSKVHQPDLVRRLRDHTGWAVREEDSAAVLFLPTGDEATYKP